MNLKINYMNQEQNVFYIGRFLGGHLLGTIGISYADIVVKLGKPHSNGDGYKIDAEWTIITPVGHCRIYNYKNGRNYCGKEGMKIKDMDDWHIGGENPAVVDFITKFLTSKTDDR
jgi:hypothetical protein